MRSILPLLFFFGALDLASAQKAAVPVYDHFDQLAPIFQKDNDTTYVINFWTTWCKPCVEELPYIEQLHADYGSAKLEVILVSLDFPNQIESKLLPFIEERGLQSKVVALTDGNYNRWIDQVEPQWGGAIPITIVYRGKERRYIGEPFHSYEEIREIVEAFVGS